MPKIYLFPHTKEAHDKLKNDNDIMVRKIKDFISTESFKSTIIKYGTGKINIDDCWFDYIYTDNDSMDYSFDLNI